MVTRKMDKILKGTRDNGNDGGNRKVNTLTILKAQNNGFASGFDTTVNTICTHPSTNCVSEGSETPVVNKTSK